MRMRRPGPVEGPIVVSDAAHGLPYSKGLMATSMMAAGIPPARAYRVAEKIEHVLVGRGARAIARGELQDLAVSMLATESEEQAAGYRRWQEVEALDVPLVLLLGGSTGVGKSTIAAQLAARLGITRVTSTDAIRQVLRTAFSQELMPTLHVSSFNADEAVRLPTPTSPNDRLILGFQEQVRAVSVGVKALIARALEEGTDIIVEGAHVVPGFLDGWEDEFAQAVLVPVVIAVSDPEVHRTHFQLRALEARARPRDRYLAHFDKIRALQAYIVEQAARSGAPVVEMVDLDSTLQEVASLVVTKALATARLRSSVADAVGEASAELPAAEMDEERSAVPNAGSRGGPYAGSNGTKSGRLRSWELLGTRRKG